METRWINHNILASSSGPYLDLKSMFYNLWEITPISSVSESESVKLALKVLPTLLFTITCNLYLGQTYLGMTMRYICHTFEDKILTANISWRFFVSPKDNLRKYRRNSQQIFKNRVSFINQLSNGFKKPQQREYLHYPLYL